MSKLCDCAWTFYVRCVPKCFGLVTEQHLKTEFETELVEIPCKSPKLPFLEWLTLQWFRSKWSKDSLESKRDARWTKPSERKLCFFMCLFELLSRFRTFRREQNMEENYDTKNTCQAGRQKARARRGKCRNDLTSKRGKTHFSHITRLLSRKKAFRKPVCT